MSWLPYSALVVKMKGYSFDLSTMEKYHVAAKQKMLAKFCLVCVEEKTTNKHIKLIHFMCCLYMKASTSINIHKHPLKVIDLFKLVESSTG